MKPKNPERYLCGLACMLPLFLMGLISMPAEPGFQEIEEEKGIIDVDALITKIKALNAQNKHEQSMELLLLALDQQGEDSLLKPLLLQTFDLFLESEVRKGEKEINKNNNNINAYLRTANALELLGENYRALEVLVNGICVTQDSSSLWMKIGKLEHKAQRDFDALAVFKEVIRLDPKNSKAYNNAAFVLAKMPDTNSKDLKEALGFALNANKLYPNNPEFIDTLAELEFRQGNPMQAQDLIKQAIKLAPKRDFFKAQLRRFSEQQVSTGQ